MANSARFGILVVISFLSGCGNGKTISDAAGSDGAREGGAASDTGQDASGDVRPDTAEDVGPDLLDGDAPTDAIPSDRSDTARDDGGDAAALVDAGSVPLEPPLLLPGTSLWLDGDVGLVRQGEIVQTWADRSGQGHLFQAQAGGLMRPQAGRVGGHGAVRFDGRNRLIIEPFPTPRQEESLTFGKGGFLTAVVFQPEAIRDAALPGGAAYLLSAQPPWLPEIPSPNVVLPPIGSHVFSLFLSSAGLSGVVAFGGPTVRVGGNYSPRVAHLVMLALSGRSLSMRVNGGAQVVVDSATPPDATLAYAPLYVGGWDFDQPGFTGDIAELVIIKGTPSDTTVTALRDYLIGKFQILP